jgi:succinyl-CoA synthetase beta subunit
VEGLSALEGCEVTMEKLLLGVEALNFLEKEGFPVLKAALASNGDEAARIASGIGFPVVLKISSPDVIHKTEEHGVKLFLKSEDEVRGAFRELVDGFARQNTGKRLDGVLVQRTGSGIELIVGSVNDRQFGPVLLFGLGGIFAEAMKDVAFRLLPIDRRDAKEMIKGLNGSKVLTNPRGETIDLASIELFLLKVSQLIVQHKQIHEMDLNPVFASSRGIDICDARMKIGRQ